MWFLTGCGAHTIEPMKVGKLKVPAAPVFDTIYMPVPSECGGAQGWLREDKSMFGYAYVTEDSKVVWYLIYKIDPVKGITESWVDPDFDGEYEMYFSTFEELLDVYPHPCSPIPSGPMSKA
jgi:hypothetical protein